MRFLSSRAMQMRPLSTRTMIIEVAKHERNGNEAAKDKNNAK